MLSLAQVLKHKMNFAPTTAKGIVIPLAVVGSFSCGQQHSGLCPDTGADGMTQ